jgi:thioredoxin-disulfide reductase
MYDLIIIGGGPAGITAGIYAARQKLNTLLITKTFGGQVARKAVLIENYPGFEGISGQELIQKFVSQLKKQKINIEQTSVAGVRKEGSNFLVSTRNKKRLQAKTIIVASGADPRPLEVPGEKKFIGRGVSYCTACDGPVFSGKTVAVIGGGNSGFEAAIFLANYAKKIYILEFGSKIAADEVNQSRVRASGKIKVLLNAALKKIQGKSFVESIVYQDRLTKKLQTLKVEGVFVEIGSIPATGFLRGLVDFSEKDEIKVNPRTLATRTSGLFAAGDVTDVKPKQIVVAAGEGAKAAFSAYNYLNRQEK